MKHPKVKLLSNDTLYKIKQKLSNKINESIYSGINKLTENDNKDFERVFHHIENMKVKFSYDAWEIFQDGFARGKKDALRKKKK